MVCVFTKNLSLKLFFHAQLCFEYYLIKWDGGTIKLNVRIFTILSVIAIVFLLMASVSATDVDSNAKKGLSANDNDELICVESDLDVVSLNMSTYSELSGELGSGGNVKLKYDYYTYDSGSTISISTPNSVIDGNGATIDMAGSDIQAFKVSASGVAIKNLTIKNANYNSEGGAIYFSSPGAVENCNFINNSAYDSGGALMFAKSGNVIGCNFTDNSVRYYGGAICFKNGGNVINCNFANNKATVGNGGAVYFDYDSFGAVENCNFNDNSASNGGAILFAGAGSLTNCNFTGNNATWHNGGAVWMNLGDAENCNFADNSASSYGGALYLFNAGEVSNCNFTNNSAKCGGATLFEANGTVIKCNFDNNEATVSGSAIWMDSGIVDYCNFNGNDAVEGSVFVNNAQSGVKYAILHS